MNQTDFFSKRLHAPLLNNQWSWGAFVPHKNRVFLRVWDSQMSKDGNQAEILWPRNVGNHSNGYAERLEHIEAIENGAQGFGVLCQPLDTTARVWKIKDYEDQVLLRFGSIIRKQKSIYVKITGQMSVSDLTGTAPTLREDNLNQKLTRISYNSRNWRQPSGDAKNLENATSYNSRNGFGHEEWLFRSEWQIDGWRYAFLEGANKSRRRLLAAQKPVDLTLFTVQPDKKRRYVANIQEVECLNDSQAKSALKIFKKKGWFKIMKAEIAAVGGNAAALGNSPEAKHILNVRFRLENIYPSKPGNFVQPNDPVMSLNRYQLYDVEKQNPKTATDSLRHRKGIKLAPVVRKLFRRAIAPVECNPEHAHMQARLFAELKQEFPAAKIVLEKDFIDVSVRTNTELILYEIKSDLEPRVVIRQALGQILEYAFHPHRAQKLPVRLIIVGRCRLSPTERLYIETLHQQFSLPLEYRVVSI